MKELLIGANEAGQRIDKFLRKLLPHLSLGEIYKMIRTRKVKVNGQKTAPNYLLALGDTLIMPEQKTKKPSQFWEDSPSSHLKIIYEDTNLLLVDKPAGILIHPASPQDKNTLIQQVLSYLYQKKEYQPEQELTFTPASCNRLDRNTSGLIIIAKNFSALQLLNEIIRSGKVNKYYQGLVKGHLQKKGEIKGYLLKDSRENKVEISSMKKEGAKEIHTIYRPLATNGLYTLLEIQLITGRTHQIRAHLASLHHPLVGDGKYGSKKVNDYFLQTFKLRHQFLHAAKLEFISPPYPLQYLAGQVFTAPLPPDLEKIRYQLLGKEDRLF